MTTDPEGSPEPRSGTPRPATWRVGTPVVLALCGALIAVSYADSEGTDLRPGRYDNMAQLAQAESDRYDAVRDDLMAVESQIADLADTVESKRIRNLRAQIEKVAGPAGLESVTGAGVRVELSDSPPEKIDDAEEYDIDLNQLVVHQQDIQAVVNAMWTAGAEAVTVNGERIATTTGIKCEGNAVTLDGVPYPQPFVIEAVGDPDTLVDTIESDDYLALYRADAANPVKEIGWELDVEEAIEAPAYDGALTLDHATPLRG